MSHTDDFIRRFVSKNRQERYLDLAGKPRRRSDFIWELAHDGRHLERAFMRPLRGKDAALPKVVELFRSMDAGPTCFVVAAAHHEFDNCEVSTEMALQAIVGSSTDSIIFFPKVGLAYYENHEGECYLLHQSKT